MNFVNVFWRGTLLISFLLLGCSAQLTQPIGADKKTVLEMSSKSDAAALKLRHFSKLGADGVLHVDTLGQKSFARAAETDQGLFKAGKEYTITFKCRFLPDPAANGSLLLAVRSDSLGSRKDIASTTIRFTGDYKEIKLPILIPAGIDDYSLKISSNGAIKAEIKDLKISEGSGDIFYPAAENSPRYTGKIGKIATGCADFKVELPRQKPNAGIVDAAKFGAVAENKKFCEALQAAINHCKKVGAKKLTLPKGVYFLYNSSPIAIEGFKDFEFDGGGSTFVFLRAKNLAELKGFSKSDVADEWSANNCMKIANCTRVKIGNFNIDWDWSIDPLASIVRVENAGTESGEKFIDYRFVDWEKFPKRDLRVANLSTYDTARNAVGIEGGITLGYEFYAGKNVPKIKWLSDNLLRVYSNHNAEVGQTYRMQHYYYDGVGVLTDSNSHLTLENINVFSCKGHAFVTSGVQQYWQYLNCNIAAPKGVGARPITCTADHCHVVNSRGFIKFDNCDFSLGADDCINIHDCSGYAQKASDFSVRTKNVGNIANYEIGDSVELRQDDFSPSGFVGKVKSTATIDKKKGVHEIFFEEKIPQQTGEGFVMFNRRFASSNVIVRNCRFHHNRARGVIIQCSNVTIENCKFEGNEGAGMRIVTGYTPNLWSEGFGVDNLLVRNCTFEETNEIDVKADGKARDIHIGIYRTFGQYSGQTMFPIMSNITFENNTFKNAYGLVAFISSSGNVIFKDNLIINTKPRKNPFYYRGGFMVKYSSNAAIVNNRYVKSPYLGSAGVFANAESVRGLIVAGNSIIDSEK